MLIANVGAIARLLRKNRDVGNWMDSWIAVTAAAQWASIQDVRRDYPTADGVSMTDGSVVTVFNVKGRLYRLLTKIDYSLQSVWIIEILTHADYNKNKWKA
jgi:mRNA interferase HigB